MRTALQLVQLIHPVTFTEKGKGRASEHFHINDGFRLEADDELERVLVYRGEVLLTRISYGIVASDLPLTPEAEARAQKVRELNEANLRAEKASEEDEEPGEQAPPTVPATAESATQEAQAAAQVLELKSEATTGQAGQLTTDPSAPDPVSSGLCHHPVGDAACVLPAGHGPNHSPTARDLTKGERKALRRAAKEGQASE